MEALRKKLTPENSLPQVRLGVASSLFAALRLKHHDTASHSLRVTLGCASMACALDLSDAERDVIEVASLLHDVGKIGIPDRILLKPGSLTPDDLAVMDQHREMGVEILRSSCADPEVLEIVATSGAWYDGSRANCPLAGSEIPLGARILAIVDAFDAMTSDQVYRAALPQERAFNELFGHAGTQFDPELVQLFAHLHGGNQRKLHEHVARRWLEVLSPERVNAGWNLFAPTNTENSQHVNPESLFEQKLLDNMRDGVVFVDASLRIIRWNAGAERMTGISGASLYQRQFVPSLLDLRDEDGVIILDEECPVAAAVESGEQRIPRLTIRGRSNEDLSVEAHVMPVVDNEGITQGATLLLHDVSPELSLEARCHSLHEMATKDPLTQVANRAEFNRVHEMFVVAHLERRLPCSLIICDIDHFKSVNDTYGHPAGDDVLKVFAKLLKTSCRAGDLVARYGGEEFVMLCADCNNATAARRADNLRKTISQVPQAALGQKNITASFGVTEIQAGDTPETMLARADRALYEAKESGRNMVVQLGTGIRGDDATNVDNKRGNQQLLAEQHLVTTVPLSVAIEKLRGFVADQQAQIKSIERNKISFQLGSSGGFLFRRSSDRNVPFLVDLEFNEIPKTEAQGFAGTRIHVAIRPRRNRDRRRPDVIDRARQLLASLRAYLMASEDPRAEIEQPPAPEESKRGLLPWLRRRS